MQNKMPNKICYKIVYYKHVHCICFNNISPNKKINTDKIDKNKNRFYEENYYAQS